MVRRRDDLFTVSSVFNDFILEKRTKGVTERYITDLSFCLNMFLEEVDLKESDDIKAITKSKVLEWTSFLQKKDISVESVNNYLRNIRTFVNWCIKNDYLPYFQVQMVKGQQERIKFYNEEELEKLLKKPSSRCSFTEYRTWVVVCFCLATGARVGTLINIKKEDVNLKESYVIYRHLKNKSSAMIPLSPSINKILSEYLRTWDIGDYIFCDIHGNQATVSAIRCALNNYCNKRSVTPRGIHALRHSFSRTWAKSGGSSFQLMKMLTHKDITMTQKYINLFSDDIQIDEFAPLDSFIKSNKTVKRV